MTALAADAMDNVPSVIEVVLAKFTAPLTTFNVVVAFPMNVSGVVRGPLKLSTLFVLEPLITIAVIPVYES